MVPDNNIEHPFFSYILLQNVSFIKILYVIGVPSHKLESDHIKEETKRFMELFETKICNERQTLYESTRPEANYYTAF